MENQSAQDKATAARTDTKQADLVQYADLSREVIAYLSKEIETITNNMMVFRSKIGFAVIVGPFLILGTLVYITKGGSLSITGDGWWIGAAVGLDLIAYLALAFLAAKIEEDAWSQCDKWRELIADLHDTPTLPIKGKNAWKDEKHVTWMKWTYLGSCALMIISFFSSLYIVSKVQTTSPVPVQSGASVSGPTPGKSP
jgi:hypothetical protein